MIALVREFCWVALSDLVLKSFTDFSLHEARIHHMKHDLRRCIYSPVTAVRRRLCDGWWFL